MPHFTKRFECFAVTGSLRGRVMTFNFDCYANSCTQSFHSYFALYFSRCFFSMHNYPPLPSQRQTFVYHLKSRSRLQGEEHSVSEFKHPRGQGQELNQTDQNKGSDFCDQNILGAISLVWIPPGEYAKLGYLRILQIVFLTGRNHLQLEINTKTGWGSFSAFSMTNTALRPGCLLSSEHPKRVLLRLQHKNMLTVMGKPHRLTPYNLGR